jgi:hypothetical protein
MTWQHGHENAEEDSQGKKKTRTCEKQATKGRQDANHM